MEVEKGDEVLLAAPVSHCRRVGMGSIAGDSVLCTGLTGSGACLQEGTRSPVLSDKAALHRGGGVAAWRGGGLVVCYGWLSSAHGGAAGSQQSASKAATGSGCKVGGGLVECLLAVPVTCHRRIGCGL
jgi:hypothetical protein